MLRDELGRRRVDELAIALRGQAEARRDRRDAILNFVEGLHRLRLGLARGWQVTQVRRKLGFDMAEKDDINGLRVRELSLELERAKEERLIGCGPLLHDAGDAGEVEIEQIER